MVRNLFESKRSTGLAGAFYNEDSRLRGDLNRMQLDLIALKAECTDDHPAVKTVQAKIKSLKGELASRRKELTEAYLAVARERRRAAERKETEIWAIFEAQQEIAQKLNATAAQYAVLQSELGRTERLCDILDSRIKELNVTEDTGALNISILEVATVGDEPSSPKKERVLALAIAVGLAGGVLLVLVRDETDQRLRSSVEISSALGIPILGSVPSLRGKGSPVTRGRTVIMDPVSNAAEAYRAIRTATYFGMPADKAKTLLITSPLQGEGKTTLVSNLAIAMAQAGQLTLVIDADFRKPMQHEVFELPVKPGLASVISGERPLDSAIRQTAIDGPDILTCGPIPGNPSEVLNSSQFRSILHELSQTYDRILLDSPPVIPVTDPSILAATCDATLLVLKAEKSTRKAAQQACDRLLSVGANILGVIVNAVPHGHDRYGYYGYGYEYHRKDDEDGQDQSPESFGVAVGQ
jgi:capsular exopolysaccharide synthesis family protein